jgi:hypothetical protein
LLGNGAAGKFIVACNHNNFDTERLERVNRRL